MLLFPSQRASARGRLFGFERSLGTLGAVICPLIAVAELATTTCGRTAAVHPIPARLKLNAITVQVLEAITDRVILTCAFKDVVCSVFPPTRCPLRELLYRTTTLVILEASTVIGGQPILILREGTQRTKGREAQSMNFTASRAVAESVRTTLGPKGMDKMLVDSMGDVVITNDGATILKEMDIEHPAAKMMVEVAKTQDDEVGDGTTTAVILAGELLKNAEELLDQDIHPTVIEKGYALAAEKAIEIAELLSRNVSIRDDDLLKKIAKTALTGKGTDVGTEILPQLVVEAVKMVAQKVDNTYKVDEEDIRIEKKVSGSVSDSELVEGIVVDKERAAEGMPRKVCDARILVYDQPLELTKTKTDAKIKIKDPTQMKLFMERDHETLIEKADKILASGANVVFCQKGIDDLLQWHFSRNNVMAVENVKREDIETISKVSGARVVSSLNDLSASDLGNAGEIEETTDIESGCDTCGID